MAEHDIKFEIEGLITLLAQNLYADPDVFLREMIQNAHDSIVKRRALARQRGAPPPEDGKILLVPAAPRSLRISDNGAGLTEEEIHAFLSTIGKSGTRDLKERLRESDRATAVELIGQFGIGLLSAFVVADHVEITTRPDDGPALRWISDGGKHYRLEPAERAQTGSDVVLSLRPQSSRYLDPDRLHAIVRRYADFIGVPILIGDETSPANAVDAPWHRPRYANPAEQHSAFLDFWEHRFRDEHSLEILAVDEPVTVPDPANESAYVEGRVRGVLGITDRHTPDVNTRGMVDVYIARMFIAQGHRDLLPAWARFIQGVVECDVLTPNAARDDVVKNSALTAVRDALGRKILAWLTDLSANKPERFVEIMRWHSYHVLAMASQEEHGELFRAVADLVPLQSDSGPLAMRDYLANAPVTDGKKTVFYVTERGAATQYYVLCRARGIHVFDAAEPFAERFLERYAATWPERVRLSRVDVAGSDLIFSALDDKDPDRERYKDLEAEYGRVFPDLRCIAKVSRFLPADLPAVLTESRDQKTRREMEEVASNVALPTFIRGLVSDFLKDKREPLQLHLNANNATIVRLARRATLRDTVAHNALIALYNNALMLLSRTITAENIQIMFRQYNEVIDRMLALSDERQKLLAENTSLEARLRQIEAPPASQARARCITCFVAMPYDRTLDTVFEALGRVLGDMPYVWDVIRADSEARGATIGESVKKHLASAHCFVADVSVENANVMFELGQMKATGKPILLLRRKTALPLPASLLGEIYVEYDLENAGLAAHLAAEIRKHPRFAQQEGERKLSETVLRSAAKERVGDAPIRAVAREFEACSDFLKADAGELARRVGIGPGTVADLQHYLREHLALAARAG